MKVKKLIWTLVGLAILSLVFLWLYFVVGFSSTYLPLEKYYSNITQNEIKQRLEILDSTQGFNVNITDTTGQYPKEYNVYFKITDNNNCEYHLKFHLDKSLIHKEQTEISLLGVFDRDKNIGGYSKLDSKYIIHLIDCFEKEVLPRINN